MRETLEIAELLDRVTDSVTVVQNLSESALKLVLRDYVSLERGTSCYHLSARDRLRRDAVEKLLIGDTSGLYRLAHAVVDEALRQGVEESAVRDDRDRLMKRADKVLSDIEIDAGLAADRRVYLRKQRRRYLQHVDSAQIGRRGESAHVAGDSAAERYHERLSRKLSTGERLVHQRDRAEVLVHLTSREDKLPGEVHADVRERRAELFAVKRIDAAVRHSEHPVVFFTPEELTERRV